MKKQIIGLLSVFTIILFAASCSSDPDSYENLLEDEKASIANYISRNGINVITDIPANNVWGANDYYLTPNGVYLHIENPGLTDSAAVYSGQVVIYRYYKKTLDVPTDTIERKWTATESPYPLSLRYNTVDLSTQCAAFHEAIKYMKYDGSYAKLIVPSKQGNTADANEVKAYAYDFRILLGD